MGQFPSFPTGRRPVSGREVRIESVGVCGQRAERGQMAACLYGYVDVAVDLTPPGEAIRVELAVEEPSGAELVSMTMIDNCQPALDWRLHLRRPPEPGVHTLHVGVFYLDELIDHVQKRFSFSTLPGEQAGSLGELT
ncbi:MAG: hypothetical protein JXM73_07715 [Anaerolineae bacterium]|nr:hypothetical protein [Anaerolineae bacterium]